MRALRQNQDKARDAVTLMTGGCLQVEHGLALAAEAGTVIVETPGRRAGSGQRSGAVRQPTVELSVGLQVS